MPKPLNIRPGMKSGRLEVVGPGDPKPVGGGRWKLRRWLCRCECGGTATVPTARLTAGQRGECVPSCGCVHREKAAESGRRSASKVWPRTCRRCKAEFLGTTKQIYCRRGCKDAPMQRHGLACLTCGEEIPYAQRGQRRRYCSGRCKRRAENVRASAAAAARLEGML